MLKDVCSLNSVSRTTALVVVRVRPEETSVNQTQNLTTTIPQKQSLQLHRWELR